MQEDFFGILGEDGDEGLEAGRTPQALSSVQYAMRTCLQAASSFMQADRFNPPILTPSRILGMLTAA